MIIKSDAVNKDGKKRRGFRNTPIQKNCVICGKEFTVYTSNGVACSDECRQIRKKQMIKIYQEENAIAITAKHLKYYKNHYTPTSKCRICGNPVIQERLPSGYRAKRHYHLDCILDDARNTLNSGEKLSKKQKIRLWNQGFTISEVMEEVNV